MPFKISTPKETVPTDNVSGTCQVPPAALCTAAAIGSGCVLAQLAPANIVALSTIGAAVAYLKHK